MTASKHANSRLQTPGSYESSASHKWDRETDVVIAGYGCAGAVAAIEAHDSGAEVLLLESTKQGGGNSVVSFGGFLCPTNVKQAIEYITGLFDLSLSDKDEELIRVFAEESVNNLDWICKLGDDIKYHSYGGAGYPAVAGAESIKKYVVHGKEKGATAFAKNLFNLLTHAVETDRKIEVLTKSPAKRLISNPEGRIIGLLAEIDGKETAIRARKGVILSTGGYEADQRMLQNHVKGFPLYSFGHPGNRGDGVRMAQKAGADLWHMNGVSCAFGLKVDEFESAFLMLFSNPAHIYVDKTGKRFVNETDIENHAGLLAVDYYDTHALHYPRIPFYVIFDETMRQGGRLSKSIGGAGVAYDWSKDNLTEIEKGWITRADSIEDLANKLHLPPEVLAKSLSTWNQNVRQGHDPQLGRVIKTDGPIASLENPPYYAMQLHPCLINTQGGPRRNSKAQIMDVFGEPIPGLYSAGELGSLWGLIYQGSGNLAECMVFGRIAGRNAATFLVP